MRRGSVAFAPRFSEHALRLVDFNRVRIRLLRPGTSPPQVALDTLIDFPATADSVRLPLTVELQGGASSEQFDLVLAMINAAGDTVFRGGPVRVTAVAGSAGGEAPDVPMVYVGVGFNAAGVGFRTPVQATVFFGDTAVFTAVAYDSAGQAMAGTPVFYRVDPQDAARATVPDETVGRVVAQSARGTARVIAELLTRQTDTTTLKVQPRPAAIAITGGNAQSGMAGTALAQSLAVRVKAADSLGVEGVVVTFSVTSGGGSVTTANVTTDTLGLASTTVTLGATVGTQGFSASAGGAGQVTFSATATPAGGVPVSIAISAGNGQSAAAGTAVPVLPSVIVRDGFNAPVSSVSVTFAIASGGGSITGASAITNASGIATIGSWMLGSTPGTNTLTASVTGLTPVTFTATGIANFITLQPNVTVQAGQSASLGITLSIGAPVGGLVVTLTSGDTTKLRVTTPTVNIAAGQTTGSATLLGVAAGTVAVTATAPGYANGGTTVSVTGVPAALTLVSGGNQIASPSTQLPQPVVVLVTDAVGNPVAGFAVTFAVATGGGSVGTPSTTTNASGQASTTWTLGAAAGTQTITVTASGLSGSPLTVAANAPVIASTTVSPQLDTITAIAATRTLVAQAKDAAGNNLTGSFTWVSRTPAVATVGVTGVVTAVTNGSTYVVATEAGGTKDSALIVVQQGLATINVVPGTRSIYLTRNFTFTATAADGGGTPLPTQPTFTWTSTAPAVATVNSAGLVTAVGLGSAQIRATSGTITGVANVSVITPITRIAVVVDTVGAFKTDTFTLTSLGLTRRYRAIAHDTLDAVMTGVSFTWVSTNGSVAVLSTPAGDTSTATSAANGLTQIRATAQGFTSAPGALLTVSQVLASIQLDPDASNPTATIGIAGTVHVQARGKDANNRYIPGGTFRYVSATPTVATVDSVTGVVTGVLAGTSAITATSGAITSNAVTVTVATTGVPPIISFGRDTVSVGRGSSASIPILLSTPAASPLTVNLGAPAFAHWSTASVTIPSGQTAINATLVGDSAGTTVVTATDGSGLGYAAGSAVAKVTANMRLTSGGYGILANDIVATQILLSDPSPAGGTYVTFNYSTAGIAAISPDPAFIPAGQLAADIQIRGLAAGSTNITPNATGVNGTASSFTAYPPVLYPSTSSIRLGLGQFEPNQYVYTQISTNVPIPVTLTSSDTNAARPSPLVVTIPSGSNYAYFNVAARAVGTATITLSSPGWTAQSAISAVATTPRLGICCGYSLLTTSPQTTVTVYAEDSLRTAHYRTNSLLVHLRSSDSTVLRVLDTVVTIGAGQYYTSAGRIIPGGAGGTAYVVATASGHGSDSTLYTVTGPSLYFSWSTARIGAGQEDYNLYVYVQNNVTAPLVVTLANPDSNILGLPTTVTIPANLNYVYFNVRGKTPGSVTLTATAPGYQQTTASYIVTTPRVTISGGTTINNFAPARAQYVYATDSLGSAHYRSTPLTVTLSSSDTNAVKTDTIATIPAGQYYTTTPPQLTPVGLGTARIVATAAGHRADSTTYTIVTPKLNFSWSSYTIGRRQHRNPNEFYVYTPDSRAVSVPVTLTQKNAAVESLTTLAPTIPANLNYQYFSFYGLANGVDTIIATATGYEPDTAFIRVSSPRFTTGGLPGSATTTSPPMTVTVYATDSVGTAHYTSDTVVVAAVSSDTAVIRPTQPFFRIPKDAYYAQPTVTITGPGTASITYSDSAATGYAPVTTNTITITGPVLTLANGSPVLGMRQRGGANSSYVYTTNAVATPLVVNLLSTGTRVATVPASVTIPTGQNYAYFEVTAQDTMGTIQIQATATGYGSAAMNVQVTVPKFVVSTSSQLYTTSAPQIITVYAADANGTAHYTTEDVVVTLVSSFPSVAVIDSSTVTIVSGNYYNQGARWSPGIVGTALIQASDARAAQYTYSTGTQGVTVVTPSLNIYSGPGALGLGQYQDYAYVQTSDYQAANLPVVFTHTGATRAGTFTNLTNTPITGLTIPQGQYYTYFRMAGVARGTDTLTASVTSPVHNPSTIYTVVDSGRVDPISGWPGSILAGDSVLVTMYARDPINQGTHYVVAATPFTLAPNANIEFHLANATVTQVTIPADAQYVQFYLVGKTAGTGSVTITSSTYRSYTTTVTVQ